MNFKYYILSTLSFALLLGSPVLANDNNTEASVTPIVEENDKVDRSIEDNNYNEIIEEDIDDSIIEEGININNIETKDTSELVPNKWFRISINESLGKAEDYISTEEDLLSVTALDIEIDPYIKGFIYIDDFTGLEKMVNLEKFEITKAFFNEDLLHALVTLPNLKSFKMASSNVIGTEATIGLNNELVNGVSGIDSLGFNPVLNIAILGNSSSLESLTVSLSQVEFIPNYLYRVRGHLVTEGLEKLTQLKELRLDSFRSIDDPHAKFLEKLENLESLRLHSIPLQSLDSVLTLDPDAIRQFDYLDIKDFTSIAEDAHGFTVFNVDPFRLNPSPYTLENNEYYATINTGQVIPNGSKELNIQVPSGTQLVSHEIIDNVLHITVKTNEFKSFNFYNPETNLVDITLKGFYFKFNYELASGVKINYSNIFAEVADFVSFDINIDDSSHYDQRVVMMKINEEGRVRIPNENDFGLVGYTILGWYTEKELINLVDFSQVQVDGTQYYAKVLKHPSLFTVTFDSNGGTLIDPISVTDGDLINKPVEPTKDKFVFEGWYKDETLSTVWNFEEDVVTRDITLYAKWSVEQQPVDPITPDPTTPETSKPEEKTPNTGICSNIVLLNVILLFSVFVLSILKKKKFR